MLPNAVTKVGVDTVMWKTRAMNKLIPLSCVAAFALLIAGCAGHPELPARSAANTVGIDLSGHWALRGSNGDRLARTAEQEQGIRLPPKSSNTSRRRQSEGRVSSRERSKSPAVYVFIESGRSLKITQTDHGLFISFDRAVVEEYTFGENRIVSLGPIEAQRVSGWEGPVFVVETMDERGVTLTETWTLTSEGSELVREIGIVDDEKQLHASRDIFDRT